VKKEDITSKLSEGTDDFFEYRDKLIKTYSPEHYYLLVIGKRIDYPSDKTYLYFGIFHYQKNFLSKFDIENSDLNDVENLKLIDEKVQQTFKGLLEYLLNIYSYIYIPSDIDIQNYTKLENDDLQKLMHKDIHAEIKQLIKQENLDLINKALQEFISNISAKLINYKYLIKSEERQNLSMNDLISKIIEAYFSTKILKNVIWVINISQ
jgi:hypothetical protein